MAKVGQKLAKHGQRWPSPDLSAFRVIFGGLGLVLRARASAIRDEARIFDELLRMTGKGPHPFPPLV